MARKPKIFRTDARLMALGEQLTSEDLETLDVDAARTVALASEEEDAEQEETHHAEGA